MRIALCLHGYFGSLTDQASTGLHGYEHIKKNILSWREAGHEVDVFVHSWQPELQDTIDELYSPISAHYEEQIDFEAIAEENKVSKKYLDPYDKLGNKALASFGGSGYVGPERILSHFYSIQEVFRLKHEHERILDFKYDWVIKSRFDLGRINRMTSGPGKPNPYACQCIDFNPEYSPAKFYMANWDLFNEGPADMWFYGSSDMMKPFEHIYDKTLNEYLQLGSHYARAVVTGWPESEQDNFRSNVGQTMFFAGEAPPLHCYPPHMVVNTILLYKWFLMDQKLWEKKMPHRS